METKLIDQYETLPAVVVDTPLPSTSLTQGIQSPMTTHFLTGYMEQFSGQLELAKQDAQDEGSPMPAQEAIYYARGTLEKWLASTISQCLFYRRPHPIFGTSFTAQGELELVFRDIALDQDRVLWISQDAKRAKLLGIDERLRLTRQVTERLW